MAESLGKNDLARGYQLAMGLMALLGTLLFLFSFFTTKERVEHVADKTPLLEQFKLLVKNGQWTLLVGVCFSGTVGYVIRGSVAIFYAKYFLGHFLCKTLFGHFLCKIHFIRARRLHFFFFFLGASKSAVPAAPVAKHRANSGTGTRACRAAFPIARATSITWKKVVHGWN